MRATLSDLLGIELPLIQGGMANIATGRFAAAVSEAGGLGLIATGGFNAQQLREHIAEARSLTNKPFGINLLLIHREVEELAAIIVEQRIPVVTTGAGNPATYVPAWRDAGSKVIPVIPSVALALRMERAGAFAVIAEGTESGGHVGELTTMALVPQVVQAVGIPVIAAGGIASGAQLCAAFALGAVGAQVGTVLLASEECPIHANYKQALLDAKDTGTTVIGRQGGTPVRTLKNRMARDYLKQEKEGATREELEMFTLGALRKAVRDGDTDAGSLMAGQVAGQLRQIRPVAEILDTLMEEYHCVRKELSAL
ncbi:MAG: nitronate monooxygenase [Coriobacteriales bacterium]|jgi:enoyl-[acyl-carrier protein] reductase II|nr:nitronate monooxygenase [Coriobacteriales bacterium]